MPLKTENFEEKKGIFSKEEKTLACFFPYIGHDKSQGKTSEGPQGLLTIIVQMLKSSLWDLRGH